METCVIKLSPDDVLEILKKHYQANDARVVCYYGHSGYSWEGLSLVIYDKPYPPIDSKQTI